MLFEDQLLAPWFLGVVALAGVLVAFVWVRRGAQIGRRVAGFLGGVLVILLLVPPPWSLAPAYLFMFGYLTDRVRRNLALVPHITIEPIAEPDATPKVHDRIWDLGTLGFDPPSYVQILPEPKAYRAELLNPERTVRAAVHWSATSVIPARAVLSSRFDVGGLITSDHRPPVEPAANRLLQVVPRGDNHALLEAHRAALDLLASHGLTPVRQADAFDTDALMAEAAHIGAWAAEAPWPRAITFQWRSRKSRLYRSSLLTSQRDLDERVAALVALQPTDSNP